MNLDSAVLYTNHVEKAAEFYQGFLGLKMSYLTPDRFVQFTFENGVGLGIKKANEAREIPGSGTIFIDAQNIEELYRQFKDKGAVFYKDLKTESWGMEFSILDPDANKVVFIQRNS